MELELKKLIEDGEGETFYDKNEQIEDICIRNNWQLKTETTKKQSLVFIRRKDNSNYLEIKVAVVGNVDSGKSTLVGVLSKGQLDNGRGSSRLNVFNHKHERITGRTTTIAHELLKYDINGNIIDDDNYWKIIQFLDLAGHEKYLGTTVYGLTSYRPDYVVVMIGANMGIQQMTKEHLSIALILKLPVFIIITKTDICPDNKLKETIEEIKRILKGFRVNKIPMVISNNDDILIASKNIINDRIVPIFCISNVTGHNVNQIRQFLNWLPSRRSLIPMDQRLNQYPLFYINRIYHKVYGAGTVVLGHLISGKISIDDKILIGPINTNHFEPITVKSIYIADEPATTLIPGKLATLTFRRLKVNLRKGIVLVHPELNPKVYWHFEADIYILYHSTTITPGYQPIIHTGNIQQSCKIEKIYDQECLRVGDRAKCLMKFLYRPEFLVVGATFIFREGRSKGYGKIIKLIINNPNNH